MPGNEGERASGVAPVGTGECEDLEPYFRWTAGGSGDGARLSPRDNALAGDEATRCQVSLPRQNRPGRTR